MNTNKFSVIIPTIWKTSNIIDIITNLIKSDYVGEIIVIDNDITKSKHLPESVIHIKSETNLYVNASWNLGVNLSQYDNICLLNDDVYLSVNTINNVLSRFRSDLGLVGVNASCYDLTIDGELEFLPTDYRTFGFGCMMLVSRDNWYPIPTNLKIAYGDDYLFNRIYPRHLITGVSIIPKPRISTSVSSSQELIDITDQDSKVWNELIRNLKTTDKIINDGLSGSICLNMIVKNESHIIENTIRNILKYIRISYWVICDTGSTDGTQEIIKRVFDEYKIPGELHQDEWKDFGHNRTLAIQRAKNKAEYTFIFDADDSIIGNLSLPEKLDKDMYRFKFGNGYNYERPLLIKNSIDWKWFGVLHEFLGTEKHADLSIESIRGEYWIDSGKNGSRNQVEDKYQRDAIILEEAYQNEISQNGGLSSRYAFYCAQSWRDAGNYEKAIEWYLKRISHGGWEEELAVSYQNAGSLSLTIGDFDRGVLLLMEGYEVNPKRAECLYELSKFYRSKSKYKLAYQFAKIAKNIPYPIYDSALFVIEPVYNWMIDFELSVSSYYVGEKSEGRRSCYRVIHNCKDDKVKQQTLNNLKFYE